jgi:hypothetical protein
VPFRGWRGKKNIFERGMVEGARRTGLSMSRTAKLLCFSHSTASSMYEEWFTTQRTSSQLDNPVERFWYLVESNTPTNWGWSG